MSSSSSRLDLTSGSMARPQTADADATADQIVRELGWNGVRAFLLEEFWRAAS
jgi:hypothetical protein